MVALEVSNLRAGYGNVEILHGISLHVGAGDYVAVIGANGAGKSTLLKAISGTVDVRGGTLRFNGQDLRARASHQVPALGIAHVPEGRQIFPALSVHDNLMTGAWLRRSREERQRSLEQVHSLFPRLRERSAQMAGTLSGGEQQMVAVGRALMLQPNMIMLDEPSQGLAPKLVGEMYERLAEVHASGTTILLVEQNTTAALKYAHSAYVMEHGRISLSGASEDLRGSDQIRRAYLGM
jgi:branched-chain amino acid transport system ATP-binding protein